MGLCTDVFHIENLESDSVQMYFVSSWKSANRSARCSTTKLTTSVVHDMLIIISYQKIIVLPKTRKQ